MRPPRGENFKRLRNNLTRGLNRGPISQAEFEAATPLSRASISAIENWDDGERNREVTAGMLEFWYRGYETLARELGVPLEITLPQVLALLGPVENQWRMDRSKGRKVTHLAYWGDTQCHEDFRSGAERIAVELGMNYRCQSFNGRAEEFIAEVETCVRNSESLLLEFPRITDKAGPVAFAIKRAAEASSRSTARGEVPFKVLMTGSPALDPRIFSIHEDGTALVELMAEQVACASPAALKVVALTSAATPMTHRRANAVGTSVRRRLEARHGNATVDFSTVDINTLNYAETRSAVERIVAEHHPKKASDPELVVAAVFFGASEFLCNIVEHLPARVRIVTAYVTLRWLKPMTEYADRWIGTAAIDARLMGAASVAILEWACLEAEGLLIEKAPAELILPVAGIHGGALEGVRTLEDVRRRFFLTPLRRLVDSYPWLHYLPIALGMEETVHC